MTTEQSDQLARIRQRADEVAKDNGCAEVMLVIEPGRQPGQATQCHIVLFLDDDAPEAAVEDVETKDQFDEIVENAAKADRQAKADQSRSELESMRDKLKEDPKGGFL